MFPKTANANGLRHSHELSLRVYLLNYCIFLLSHCQYIFPNSQFYCINWSNFRVIHPGIIPPGTPVQAIRPKHCIPDVLKNSFIARS